MHYSSGSDAQLMRRRAMDPSILMRRTRQYRTFGALTDITQVGKGSTLQSAAAGVSAGVTVGAAIGSVVPIAGTAIGALVGGAVGAIAAAFNRQDQEVQNFDQAQAIAHANGPAAVLNIANKYLVLAGLFDLNASQIKGNIPFYKKYGRMGEYAFVVAMCNLIQSAADSGVININDTPQSVYSKVVLPWINGMGYGPLADSNAEMLGYILMGMIGEYCAGIYHQRWYARSGDMPFGSLHPFSLPGTGQTPVTSSPTPSPQVSQAGPVSELQSYQNGALPEKGAIVNYARGDTGWLQLPQPMRYQGRTSSGAWIVATQDGTQYTLQGSNLVPVNVPAPATVAPTPTSSQPALPSQTVTSPSSAADSTSSNPYTAPQYIQTGGGGGGYYPTASTPTAVTAEGLSTTTLLQWGLGAAAVVGALYMLSKRGHS